MSDPLADVVLAPWQVRLLEGLMERGEYISILPTRQPTRDWTTATGAEILTEMRRLSAASGTVVSPDSMTVRLASMTAEAEAEMAEWDAILRGEP